MYLSKWQMRFLDLAEHVADWSKDPSTKVGAVIVRPDNTIASMGFNGFPRGVEDDDRLTNRDLKYEIVVHAEANALLMAKEPLTGYWLYTWPLPPCSRCAGLVIQAGIGAVIALAPEDRWFASCDLGRKLLEEAGVTVWWVDEKGERVW